MEFATVMDLVFFCIDDARQRSREIFQRDPQQRLLTVFQHVRELQAFSIYGDFPLLAQVVQGAAQAGVVLETHEIYQVLSKLREFRGYNWVQRREFAEQLVELVNQRCERERQTAEEVRKQEEALAAAGMDMEEPAPDVDATPSAGRRPRTKRKTVPPRPDPLNGISWPDVVRAVLHEAAITSTQDLYAAVEQRWPDRKVNPNWKAAVRRSLYELVQSGVVTSTASGGWQLSRKASAA